MPELEFQFARKDATEPSGFDLGDITVSGNREASSDNRSPNQSMMLYLSLVDLIDGVAHLCSAKRPGKYEFVGTDSSFTLTFSTGGKDAATVADSRGVLATTTRRKLLAALNEALNQFLTGGHELPPTDPVGEDFLAARKVLVEALG